MKTPCLLTIQEQKQLKNLLSNSETLVAKITEKIMAEVDVRIEESKPAHAKAFKWIGNKIVAGAKVVAESTVKAAKTVAEETPKAAAWAAEGIKETATSTAQKVAEKFKKEELQTGDYGSFCYIKAEPPHKRTVKEWFKDVKTAMTEASPIPVVATRTIVIDMAENTEGAKS
jgi:hypothetical protein